MKNDVSEKIAVIGAGPSGMGAAEALKIKGYENVTIFEKNNRVGGMTLSRTYQPKDEALPIITYDLGSVQPVASKRLFKLLKQEGLNLRKEINAHTIKKYRLYSFGSRNYPVDFLNYELGVPISQLPVIMLDVIRLSSWIIKFRRLYHPGFSNINNVNEIAVPFPKWLRERNFIFLGRVLNAICTASLNSASYAGNDDRSMLYTLKVFMRDMLTYPTTYFRGNLYPVREGYQELWNRVARRHNVILDARISKIKRQNNAVTLCFSDGTEQTFDRLVIACNLSGLLDILDVTPEERVIFSEVKHVGSWRAAFTAKNMPNDAGYVFLDQAENPDFAPAISGFIPEGYVGDKKYLYSTLVGYTDPVGLEPVLERSTILLKEHFNASEVEWVDKAYWPDYNSHFSSQAIISGIFDRFEAIQGSNKTYYVGEIISGQSNGICMDYSFDMVNRFF